MLDSHFPWVAWHLADFTKCRCQISFRRLSWISFCRLLMDHTHWEWRWTKFQPIKNGNKFGAHSTAAGPYPIQKIYNYSIITTLSLVTWRLYSRLQCSVYRYLFIEETLPDNQLYSLIVFEMFEIFEILTNVSSSVKPVMHNKQYYWETAYIYAVVFVS